MKKGFLSVLSTTQTIMLGFLAAIAAGSILLALPICSKDGSAVPFIDALFTAATSVCVTGLVTVPTVSTWSIWGQIVILLLIQAGGLGIITVISALMVSLHRKMGLASRMLIQDTFNLNTMSGLIRFLQKVLIGTFAVEGTGALLYMTVFVPRFGLRGIWISVFTAVSAFCNAGIDIIAENSLCDFVHDPVVNLVTSLLVILGGIGYIVWWDVLLNLRASRRKEEKKSRLHLPQSPAAAGRDFLRSLTLHSKIALSATAILLVLGMIVFLVFESGNPETMKNYTVPERILAAFFQSMTTRTAGFATIPQENLTNASSVFSLLLMFIGGSPSGTAGGVKTVTMAVLFASTFSTIRNKENTVLFHRTITRQAIGKASAVVGFSFLVLFTASVLLSACTNADVMDILYETVSATATVGLTRNLTSSLNLWGKLIIIVTMYLGRVGPISLFIALNRKKEKSNVVKDPAEPISVG